MKFKTGVPGLWYVLNSFFQDGFLDPLLTLCNRYIRNTERSILSEFSVSWLIASLERVCRLTPISSDSCTPMCGGYQADIQSFVLALCEIPALASVHCFQRLNLKYVLPAQYKHSKCGRLDKVCTIYCRLALCKHALSKRTIPVARIYKTSMWRLLKLRYPLRLITFFSLFFHVLDFISVCSQTLKVR